MLVSKLEDYFYNSPLAFMRTVPSDSVVFDRRSRYVCKFGCKNYNRKYSCPPASLNLSRKINNGNYKWVLLFATTYRVPENYSKWQSLGLNRQKEMEIQRISAEINNIFNLNGANYVVLAGGACKRCKRCSLIDGGSCKKPKKKQVSMEAVGIDCMKTMHVAGFDFEMPNNGSINRCGCVFINEPELPDIELKKRDTYQRFRPPSKNENEEAVSRLLNEHPKLFEDMEIVPVSQINSESDICTEECEYYGKNFACPPFSDEINLSLWENAVIWKWRENKYKKYSYNVALKKIHSCFFSLGHYFALSLRDCYCDACSLCAYATDEKPVCAQRKLLSPSMQSQGIEPSSFGEGKYGIELI